MGEIKRAARRNPSGFLIASKQQALPDTRIVPAAMSISSHVTASSSDWRRECSASRTGNADGVPTAAAMSFGICSGSSHCRMFVFNGGKVTLGAFIPFSPSRDTIKRKAFLSVFGEHRRAYALHTACQSVFASIGRPMTEEKREIYFFILHRDKKPGTVIPCRVFLLSRQTAAVLGRVFPIPRPAFPP